MYFNRMVSIFQAMNDESGVGLEVLMERMRKLTESSIDDMSPEELLKRFQSVKHQSAESRSLQCVLLCF